MWRGRHDREQSAATCVIYLTQGQICSIKESRSPGTRWREAGAPGGDRACKTRDASSNEANMTSLARQYINCRSAIIASSDGRWRTCMSQAPSLFGQKRQKVGRLQRQAARCFLVMPEADSMELGTWCWPRVVLIEKRPLTECERSSMNRAARSVGARQVRRLGRNNWIWRLPNHVAARWR